MDVDPTSKAYHHQIRLATNMKFAGVNIYGHPNISCEDQHRLTTKKFFYRSIFSVVSWMSLIGPSSPLSQPHTSTSMS
jgi:hypothetical protein